MTVEALRSSESTEEEFACIGDHVCFFSTDNAGYMFSDRTSSYKNGLFIYTNQDKDKPLNIPNPQVVTFRICIENRYRMTKKYRKLNQNVADTSVNEYDETLLYAKQCAEAEQQDNTAEQRRLHGKPIQYGDIIQLRHVFSDKYIHTNNTNTSARDKSKLVVHLLSYEGKTAQFRILPKYKVNTEGDYVRLMDQVVFESVKTPHHYLSTSPPFLEEDMGVCCELNLGVGAAEFMIRKRFRTDDAAFSGNKKLWGGAIVQLLHKHQEGYLSAAGLFGHEPTEDVHLMIRKADVLRPKTLYPPTSATTLWQIEHEASIISGEAVKWGQQIRIRHLCTRMYLYVVDSELGLTLDGADPKTVFRLQPKDRKQGDTLDGDCGRLQNVLSELWLTGIKDSKYVPKSHVIAVDTSPRIQVGVSTEMLYPDTFLIQLANFNQIIDYNFISAIAPVLEWKDVALSDEELDSDENSKRLHVLLGTFNDIHTFLGATVDRRRNRRRLLGEMNILDLLIEILQKAESKWKSRTERLLLMSAIYDILYTCVRAKSVSPAIMLTAYLDFFLSQMSLKGGFGVYATQMVVELVQNRREVIQRITEKQVDTFTSLLKKSEHPRLLQLLSAVCVCDKMSMPNFQMRICNKLFKKRKNMLHFQLRDDVVWVTKGKMDKYILELPLRDFLNVRRSDYFESDYDFLSEELRLLEKLCHGRNHECIQTIIETTLSWEAAMIALTDTDIPDTVRALFADLILVLFINVGESTSILDGACNTYVFDKINIDVTPHQWLFSQASFMDPSLELKLPELKKWTAEFLSEHTSMVASQIHTNKLIFSVLRIIYFLVMYGYMTPADQSRFQPHILALLDGRNDLPQPQKPGQEKKRKSERVSRYQQEGRYEPGEQTNAVVNAKLQAMEILDFLQKMSMQFQVERLAGLFKRTLDDEAEYGPSVLKYVSPLTQLLRPDFKPEKTSWRVPDPKKAMKIALDERIIESSRILEDHTNLVVILQDMSHYKYDTMTDMAISLLHNYYNTSSILLERAMTAQLLLTPDTQSLYRDIQAFIPLLRRLVSAKMSREQMQIVVAILDKFKESCIHKETGKPHTIGQYMIANHGIIDLLIPVLTVDHSAKDNDTYGECVRLTSTVLQLLRLLVEGNASLQGRVCQHLDTLLKLRICPRELADTLRELFLYNTNVSWHIDGSHVNTVVQKICEHRERAPAFVQVLTAMMVADEDGTVIRRNQTLVMNFFLQCYPRDAYVLELPQQQRCNIICGSEGEDKQRYLLNIINLLVISCQGSNGSIRSFCHNVLPARDGLQLMAKSKIGVNQKRPLVKYINNTYLLDARRNDQMMEHLLHSRPMWDYIACLNEHMERCIKYRDADDGKALILVNSMDDCFTPEEDNEFEQVKAIIYYLVDAVLDFLHEFCNLYTVDTERFPQEARILKDLVKNITALIPSIVRATDKPRHQVSLKRTSSRIMKIAGYSTTEIDSVVEQIDRNKNIPQRGLPSREAATLPGSVRNFSNEIKLNERFRVFVRNIQACVAIPNTIEAQIGIHHALVRKKPYIHEFAAEKLPLKEGFQKFVKSFMDEGLKNINLRYIGTTVLVKHLNRSALKAKEVMIHEARETDICSLHILRAILHNHICIIPQHWREEMTRFEKRLEVIQKIQNFYVEQGLVDTLFGLLNIQDRQILREVLALFCCLSFNANPVVQNASLAYFKSTKEEVFFLVMRDVFQRAELLIKERRALKAQLEKTQDRHHSVPVKKAGWFKRLRSRISRPSTRIDDDEEEKLIEKEENHEGVEMVETLQQSQDMVKQVSTNRKETTHLSMGQAEDGNVGLVLKMLSALCDGQHRGLQDYLRDQPDNLRSFNIVAAAANFLSRTCQTITGKDVDILIQIFATLNEITQGNQENRLVLLNNKVVDNMNLVLRHGGYEDCPVMNVFKLQEAIADLIMALIEESTASKDSINIAKEVASTIDLKAVLQTIKTCYDTSKYTWWRSFTWRRKLGKKKENRVFSLESVRFTRKQIDQVKAIGRKYYIVYSSLKDARSDGLEAEVGHKVRNALEFFGESICSVEILKDSNVHRVYFSIPEGANIRNEMKETVKWNIDRTSHSNKLRDFLTWSHVTIRDILYNRKVLSNPIARFIANQWMLWNYICILISLAINVIMLVTWEAPESEWIQKMIQNGSAPVPPVPSGSSTNRMYPITPLMVNYNEVLQIIGAVHNVFSIVLLISFFLSQNPRLPKLTLLRKFYRKLRGKSEQASAGRNNESAKRGVALFGFSTFWYLLFVASSFLGTWTHGYFFAFHLLNIVNINQLLKHVIRAVTLNGKSLIWVMVLGLLFLYIYTLIGFAFFRPSFHPENNMFCSTLYRCSVTIIRYGLIGDINESLQNIGPTGSDSFTNFGYMVIYQVSFFIIFTTILLNIIFGIIVDTFSELRDLKWQAEKDMQDLCFICGRQSYEFEHYSKGFRHHVRKDHSMWSYIYYFLYLADMNPNDFTALDSYVHKLLKENRYDFFPINRALCLVNIEDDSGESRMEGIIQNVEFLVQNEHKKVAQSRYKHQRQEQLYWKKKQTLHRQVSLLEEKKINISRERTLSELKEAPAVAEEPSPSVGPDTPSVGPDTPSVGPDTPSVGPDTPSVGPYSPPVGHAPSLV